jgi:hypothetical protein
VLARLSRPQRFGVILEENSETTRELLAHALTLLLAEGFISGATEAGDAEVDDHLALRQWEFHDLLFHSRTRFGRHRNPMGGTYRFRNIIDPLPAVKPPMSAIRISLFHPDLDRIAGRELSLTAALERRNSVRHYGGALVTMAELGEFLYRVGRVRRTLTIDGVELTSRPYPNGGASHELEL